MSGKKMRGRGGVMATKKKSEAGKVVSRVKRAVSVRAGAGKQVKKAARRENVKAKPSGSHAAEQKASAKTTKEQKKREEEGLYKIDAKRVIEEMVANSAAMEYLHKNVSKRAGEVINALDVPKTDEKIAEELDIKINTVRRILNIMYGYGITNYSVIKNSKGWLSFMWVVNLRKVNEFYEYINKNDSNTAVITENSNDYFVCKSCYSNNKLVFDFDSAFEASFKCILCGNKLQRLDKEEARQLIESRNIDSATL